MILPTILALTLLSVADPSGDAFGDGTLVPPTAPVYANAAVFDLQSVTLEAAPAGTRLAVTLGSLGLSPAGGQGEAPPAAGDAASAAEPEVPLQAFLPAVVDVYLGEVQGGSEQTLPGPDLRFAQHAGWLYAVRITSDGAYYVAYPQATPSADPLTPLEGAVDPGSLPGTPLDVLTNGSELIVYLPFQLEADVAVQAMTGVYDPFSHTGWRPLAKSASPWAFSGGAGQVSPVVDLLAQGADAQRAALQTGVLPRLVHAPTVLNVPWLWVMGAGLVLALLGLVLRGRVRAPARAKADVAPDGAPAAEGAADAEGGAGASGAAEAAATEAAPAEDTDEVILDHEDDEELIDPRASAAHLLASEVAAADEAGAKDQGLLVDGHDDFVLDTGERLAAAQAAHAAAEAGSAPAAAEPEAPAAGRGAELNGAEGSFLLDLDDPRAVEDFLGVDADDESFWHPRSRKHEPATPAQADTDADAPDAGSGARPDDEAGAS